MVAIKACPTCGSKRIARVKRNLVRTYRGRRYVVPDLEFYECPKCDERLFDREASRRIDECSPAFARTPRRKSA
jgi:YgiT-type zinc finger domain-containing protein